MIHCSDSLMGDVDAIRKWHIERGWNDIGYNWVILNGCRHWEKQSRIMSPLYHKEDDGILENGRDIKFIGAHAKGYNESFLSVCLIGKHHFTLKQIECLFRMIKILRESNQIDYFHDGTSVTSDNIKGHYEVNSNKTCPNIDLNWLRDLLNAWLFKNKNGGFLL